jgi:hypothetical protein
MRSPFGWLAVAGLALMFSSGPALAAAMSCSSEQAACLQVCRAANAKSPASVCINDCASRHSACMHTGCWNNGKLNYCGLSRK